MGFFELSRRPRGRALHVVVRGELDVETGSEVDAALVAAQAEPVDAVVLDLSGVTFFDSTGLQVVLDADVRSRASGQAYSVVLAAADSEPRRVLALARVLDRLVLEPVDPDLDPA